MSDNGEKRLPSAWVVLTLGEVRVDQSRSIVPGKQPNDKFELYSVPSFDSGKPEIVQGQSIGSNKQTVETDTVLLCKINPRINRVWVVENYSLHPKIASTEWIPFFRSKEFLPKYLCYYMRRGEFRDHLASQASGVGGSLMRIKASNLAGYPLPIAPFPEQRRIVAKIEELFSELDKGVESLKTARAQLKVYRQAVLKHAFEGKLTTQWREENKDKLEKPEQLLARIKQEREARYELQRKEWAAAVKKWEESGGLERKPSSPRPPSFPEPFTDIELMALPEIFGLWRWVKVGELFSVYVGATPSRKNRSYWNGAINWISSGEVRFAPINKTNETVTPEGLASASTEIHPIGTVMLAMIGEGKTRGQAAVTHVEACHNQNTAAIRVSESEISPEYVYYYLLYRYEDTRRVGSGNNQKALNKERVSNLPIPLPSLNEQAVVVQELKKLLSAIEQLDREICNQLTSASALRQSILKKAFTGQLVAQDPNDEPASVLLDRIRAEREKAAKNNHSKKTKKRKTAV